MSKKVPIVKKLVSEIQSLDIIGLYQINDSDTWSADFVPGSDRCQFFWLEVRAVDVTPTGNYRLVTTRCTVIVPSDKKIDWNPDGCLQKESGATQNIGRPASRQVRGISIE